MPNDARILPLLELLSGPLSLEKLETLTREFQELAQDRAETSAFFVLQHVAQRLTSELDDEAVDSDRFQELTAGIAEAMRSVLADLQEDRAVIRKLDNLVSVLFRNLGMYRSRD